MWTIAVRMLTSGCSMSNWLEWQIQFNLSPSVCLLLPLLSAAPSIVSFCKFTLSSHSPGRSICLLVVRTEPHIQVHSYWPVRPEGVRDMNGSFTSQERYLPERWVLNAASEAGYKGKASSSIFCCVPGTLVLYLNGK